MTELSRLTMLRTFGGDTPSQVKLREDLQSGDFAKLRNLTEVEMVSELAEEYGFRVYVDFTRNTITIEEVPAVIGRKKPVETEEENSEGDDWIKEMFKKQR